MKQRNPGRRWFIAAGLAGVLVLVAFNFDALMLGAAVLFGDKRPALLRDARWVILTAQSISISGLLQEPRKPCL